jgi:hypothetical protein
MARRVAYPFLVLPDDVVRHGPWMLGDPGQPLNPVSDVVDNWDYEKDLEVSISLDIDFEEASNALDIDAHSLTLDAILKIGTGTGTFPRRIERLTVQPVTASNNNIELTALIPSHNLSGRLLLECEIVLKDIPEGLGTLSPGMIGARLWQTNKDLLIEDGGDSRFPIETASFKVRFNKQLHMNSPWFIYWQPDSWNLDFGGSVRVYINSDFSDIEKKVAEGDSFVLQMLLSDVMSQMIEAAITTEEIEEILDGCDEGTVGNQILHWIDIIFPGQSISSIVSLKSHRPGQFRAAILAAAEIGAE